MAKRSVEILIKAKDQTKKATSSVGQGMSGLSKSIAGNTKLMIGLGTAAVAAFTAASVAAFKFLDAVATMEDDLAKAARRAQTDIQTYGEWGYVFERAGASATAVERSMQALVKQMGTAQTGSKETLDAFKDLGVEFQNSNGTLRDGTQVFEEAIAKLADMEDESKRAYLAQVLLGRGGKALIPVLAQTSDEIQKQRDQYTELGGAAVTSASEVGEAWVDAQLNIKTAKDGINASLLAAFGPEIVAIMEGFATTLAAIQRQFDDFDPGDGVEEINGFFDSMERFIEVGGPATAVIHNINQALYDFNNGDIKGFASNFGEASQALRDFQEARTAVDTGDKPLFSDLVGDPSTLGPYSSEFDIIVDQTNRAKIAADSWNASLKETGVAALELWAGWEGHVDVLTGLPVLYEDLGIQIGNVRDRAEALHVESRGMSETVLQSVHAADAFGNSLANAVTESSFRVVQGEAEDLTDYITGTLLGALQSVIVKLVAIKTIEAFTSLFNPFSLPGNFGQFTPGVSSFVDKSLISQSKASYASPSDAGLAGAGNTVVLNLGLPDTQAGLQRVKDSTLDLLNSGGAI